MSAITAMDRGEKPPPSGPLAEKKPVSYVMDTPFSFAKFFRDILFMKLQRQAVRILEKGHFFLREFIDPYRFRFNAEPMEPGDCLIHVGNAEGEMAQTACLGIAGPFRTSRNTENLKLAVAQLQIQLVTNVITTVSSIITEMPSEEGEEVGVDMFVKAADDLRLISKTSQKLKEGGVDTIDIGSLSDIIQSFIDSATESEEGTN